MLRAFKLAAAHFLTNADGRPAFCLHKRSLKLLSKFQQMTAVFVEWRVTPSKEIIHVTSASVKMLGTNTQPELHQYFPLLVCSHKLVLVSYVGPCQKLKMRPKNVQNLDNFLVINLLCP